MAWQKVVDLPGGAVEDTGAADLPASVDEALETYPVPTNRGLRTSSRDDRIEVIGYGLGAQRYLFAENGPPGYQLGYDPIWSPSGEWFLIEEGRLVVVTVRNPPTSRVLAGDPGWIGSTPAGFPVITFTDADLLDAG